MERDWEREHQVRGERGGIGGRKRNDLCKADVSLSRLWEITGKRLIMPTSTLLFSKTKEQPSPTPHSISQSCYPALPTFPLLFYQSRSLALGHTHTQTYNQRQREKERERVRERERKRERTTTTTSTTTYIHVSVVACVCT